MARSPYTRITFVWFAGTVVLALIFGGYEAYKRIKLGVLVSQAHAEDQATRGLARHQIEGWGSAALPHLIREWSDESQRDRHWGIRPTLDGHSMPAVAQLLKDLGASGYEARVREAVEPDFESGLERIRSLAAYTVATKNTWKTPPGPSEPSPELVQHLIGSLDDQDPLVRLWAIYDLGSFKTPPVAALPRALEFVDDPDPLVRCHLIALLVKLERHKPASEGLVALLSDTHPVVLGKTLEAIGSPRRLVHITERPVRVTELLLHEELIVRHRAASVATRFGLTDSDAAAIAAAVRDGGRMTDWDARDPLVLSARSGWSRTYLPNNDIMRGLASLGTAAAPLKPTLLQLVDEKGDIEALKSLVELAPDEGIPRLVSAASMGDGEIPAERHAKAIRLLAATTARETDGLEPDGLRGQAVTIFRGFLDHDDRMIRLRSAIALAELDPKDRSTVELLADIYRDLRANPPKPIGGYRWSSCNPEAPLKALSHLGGPEAIDALINAVQSDNDMLRINCPEMLVEAYRVEDLLDQELLDRGVEALRQMIFGEGSGESKFSLNPTNQIGRLVYRASQVGAAPSDPAGLTSMLISVCEGNPDGAVRNGASVSLVAFGELAKSGGPTFVRWLDEPNQWRFGARCIGGLGPSAEDLVPKLLDGLTQEPSHTSESVNALAAIGPAARSALPDVEAWQPGGETLAELKRYALSRIAPDKYPAAGLSDDLVERARPDLIAHRDHPPAWRLALGKRLEMLGQLGTGAVASQPFLVETFDIAQSTGSWQLRWYAVKAIDGITRPSREARRVLETASLDSETRIRRSAEIALHRLKISEGGSNDGSGLPGRLLE
ncbi:hypothetical protein Pla123a_25890 [Posidoniimonas polymericola]|uniref:HEAT repeat protein n=1 Tax=Posidoniimonas polymericola TaxID=2528002 RepID=A0A5C5YLW9_9BACT|nr:HEAT repeat domain-containing protein [Posidoniimonas polymericola]TWT75807.1 hypothetical protein Pla123a_25890 [Posidoniimonas polymericola]